MVNSNTCDNTELHMTQIIILEYSHNDDNYRNNYNNNCINNDKYNHIKSC